MNKIAKYDKIVENISLLNIHEYIERLSSCLEKTLYNMEFSYELNLEPIDEDMLFEKANALLDRSKKDVKDLIRYFNSDIAGKKLVTSCRTRLNAIERNHDIIKEKLEYLSKALSRDQSEGRYVYFLLQAKIDEYEYGSIMVFIYQDFKDGKWELLKTNKGKKIIVMQLITKNIYFILLELLYPILQDKLPKLNSLLIPKIEQIARSYEADYIMVYSYSMQKRLLLDYYGFKELPKDDEIPYKARIVKGGLYKEILK